MTDSFTTEARLCDDDGIISHAIVTDRKVVEPEDRTYLERINILRAQTAPLGEHKPLEEPFHCTGSAHLAGQHIRCTSPAHTWKTDWQGLYCDPLVIIDSKAIAKILDILDRNI